MTRTLLMLILILTYANANAEPMRRHTMQDTLQSIQTLQIRPDGPLGLRINNIAANWLVQAPVANPGMLSMFKVRDRLPTPDIMPWAGEFAGKYLISVVQALSVTQDHQLRRTAQQFVKALIANQDADGYLGPFPKQVRLKANWDMWGHYHVMLGLWMWYKATGDEQARECVWRAARLMERTFLDGDLRVFDAGSQEMNMSAAHILAILHRESGDARTDALYRQIEEDWTKAGDYLQLGLKGVPFYRGPRPRWESLPALQALLERGRATGDARYRDAVVNLWNSIERFDVHNAGSFSTNEQAIGLPWVPGAIETCCTVAWMALSVDVLRSTGDPLIADELERATWNAVGGYVHPSGRWSTYDTPMDGRRQASAHHIVFQARAGTPELNCCSVNAPRGYTMLADWALMAHDGGYTLNWYGPGAYRIPNGNQPILLVVNTDYPASGRISLRWELQKPRHMSLRLRIPAWSRQSTVTVNDGKPVPVQPGYYEITREWRSDDTIRLDLDMRVREEPGGGPLEGRVSLFRGPILLSWDQYYNTQDEPDIPAVRLEQLDHAESIPVKPNPSDMMRSLTPMVMLRVQTNGEPIVLCDYASAGAHGTPYRSWLRSDRAYPAPPIGMAPYDGTKLPTGPAVFRWFPSDKTVPVTYTLQFAGDPSFHHVVWSLQSLGGARVEADLSRLPISLHHKRVYWRVVANRDGLESVSPRPLMWFVLDPSAPVLTEIERQRMLGQAPAVLVSDSLAGKPAPDTGSLVASAGSPVSPLGELASAVQLNGETDKIIYETGELPGEAYTASIEVRIDAFPNGRIGQILSCWAAPLDDPLRITLENGKLSARIEASYQIFSTPPVDVQTGRWMHIKAVKNGPLLSLYIDGTRVGQTSCTAEVYTQSHRVAVGGNPLYAGNECAAITVRNFRFLSTAEEP